MKIAIIALVKLEKDKLSRYNPQSLGLAKGMAALGCDEVDVYSFECLDGSSRKVTQVAPQVRLIQQDVPAFGGNTVAVTKRLQTGYTRILCFSDIQFSYAGLDHWCRKNRIPLFPYVGVVRSSHPNRWARAVMDRVAKRNIRNYRRRLVFAKTEPVRRQLENESVSTVLAPVGLDLSCLNRDFSRSTVEDCKSEAGFRSEDRVLLFVGRLAEEKRPLALIDLFREIHARDPRFKLCVVGDGPLRSAVRRKISGSGLTDQVRLHPVVKNVEMWRFYRMADFSLNLNVGEIFGMSILEAMYYRTPVIARRAPGPEMIIRHGEDGYLCDSDAGILEILTAPSHRVSVEKAHRKIVQDFSWERSARLMLDAMESEIRRRGPA